MGRVINFVVTNLCSHLKDRSMRFSVLGFPKFTNRTVVVTTSRAYRKLGILNYSGRLYNKTHEASRVFTNLPSSITSSLIIKVSPPPQPCNIMSLLSLQRGSFFSSLLQPLRQLFTKFFIVHDLLFLRPLIS